MNYFGFFYVHVYLKKIIYLCNITPATVFRQRLWLPKASYFIIVRCTDRQLLHNINFKIEKLNITKTYLYSQHLIIKIWCIAERFSQYPQLIVNVSNQSVIVVCEGISVKVLFFIVDLLNHSQSLKLTLLYFGAEFTCIYVGVALEILKVF